ncbi:Deoxyribose-phosphate aldolase [compost metagenome]
MNATPEAARIILECIAESAGKVGFKASGGLRTLEDARLYLEMAESMMGAAWISPRHLRFGASALLDDLLRHLKAMQVAEAAKRDA